MHYSIDGMYIVQQVMSFHVVVKVKLRVALCLHRQEVEMCEAYFPGEQISFTTGSIMELVIVLYTQYFPLSCLQRVTDTGK